MDGKKLVVLKEAVVPESSAENIREKAREMFEREAHLLTKTRSSVHRENLDCFVENGRNYLLLEHASGTDLRQLVETKWTAEESDVLEWAIQIANAVKYLHDKDTADHSP